VPAFICPEDPAQFINRSTGPIDSWSWDFGNGQSGIQQDPPPQWYPVTGAETSYTITLTASNSNGCTDSKTKTLKVLATCIIAVPTGFTPNNDGLNDYLFPLNAFKAEDLDFRVYNRWGEMVFFTTDWTKKWDGRIKGVLQGSGVFAWTLRYKDKTTGVRYSLKGTTVLIR
jgi:gliding motility-associated-like protein